MTALYWILGLVAVQRLIELAHARSNTVRLRRLGAVEADAGAYPLFVLLHAGWLSPAGLRMRPGRGAGPGRRRRLVGAPPPAQARIAPERFICRPSGREFVNFDKPGSDISALILCGAGAICLIVGVRINLLRVLPVSMIGR